VNDYSPANDLYFICIRASICLPYKDHFIKQFTMSINLLETVQQNLGYPPLQKIDPNTQQVTANDKTPDEDKFSQAAIPAILTGMFKFVQSEEGATVFLMNDNRNTWMDRIFPDHQKEAIESISAYSKQSDEDPVAKMNEIANETEKLVKEQLPENATPRDLGEFFRHQKNHILLYLPAALNLGKLLNDNALDDNTHKMEGPISSLMRNIGTALSNTNKEEEPVKES
jgi:hypothetical protein